MLRLRTLFPYLALLVLTFAAYGPVWRNDFIDLDDEVYITGNPNVKAGLSWKGFAWAWTTTHGNYWQPLSWLSLQLDADLFSTRPLDSEVVLSPAAFHAQNLFWHTASVLLLFAVWQRLTGAPWCSFMVAGLFAVHPMHVESVAWAAERKDVLSTFFGVLCLWAYAGYVEDRTWPRYLGVAGCLLLSLCAKPMLMTMPFILLLLDYWPLGRVAPRGWSVEGNDRPSPSRLRVPPAAVLLEKVPLLLIAGAIAVVTFVLRDRAGSAVSLAELPLSDRLGNALVAYAWYIGRSFWPTHLSAFYLHPLHNWSLSGAVIGATLLVVVSAMACWQVRRRRWLFVGWFWFIGSLSPVIGLSQGGMQAWADRFTYWPHIGLAVAVVWGLAEVIVRVRVPAWAAGAAAALALVGLAVGTWFQVGYWRDTPTLWHRVLAVTEGNHRAHLNLGNDLMERRRYDEAASHYAECVRLLPNSGEYHYRLGSALMILGRYEEAAEQCLEVVHRVPDHVEAWYLLGLARWHEGESEKALRAFRRAVEIDPQSGKSWAMIGKALLRLGQREEARAALHQALQCDPRESDAWHGLGLLALAQGQVREAIEDLTQGVQYGPELVTCHSDLGVALGRAGRWAEAVARQMVAIRQQTNGEEVLAKMGGRPPVQFGVPRLVIFRCRLAYALNRRNERRLAGVAYREAHERHPQWPDDFARRAWTLLTDPDPNRRDPQTAYELASQAVEGVGDPSAQLLDVLAAAEAARGDFAAAARTAQQALDKASAAGDMVLANVVRDHLRLYEQRKPVGATAPERPAAGDS